MKNNLELTDEFLQQLSYYKHYGCFQYDNDEKQYLQIHTQKEIRQHQIQEIKQCIQQENELQQKINKMKDDIEQLEEEKADIVIQKKQYQTNAQLLMNTKCQEQFQITKMILDIKASNPAIQQPKNGNSSIVKKRRTFSEQEKKQVIKGLSVYSLKKLSEISNIHQNQILKWSKSDNKCSQKTGRPITSLDLEQILVDYVKSMRRLKRKISKKHLREKAEREAASLNVNIKASMGYINGFLKRNNFTLRKINSQKQVIVSEDIIRSFTNQIIEKLNTNDYDLNQVINFDESGVYKDDTGTLTIAEKGERHVLVQTGGETKKCYSVGLAISFTGTKLKQTIVWPTKGIRDVFRIVIPNNTEIIYRDKISYFNQDIFKQWIDLILKPHSKLMMENKKGILLIDNFTGHQFEGIQDLLKELKYELIYLPSNTTDRLQPLDCNINRIYKNLYKQKWMDHQLLLSEKDDTKISHGQYLTYLSEVWEEITTENVLSAWSQYHLQIEEKKQVKESQNKMVNEEDDETNEEDLYIFNQDSYSETQNISSNQMQEEETPIEN